MILDLNESLKVLVTKEEITNAENISIQTEKGRDVLLSKWIHSLNIPIPSWNGKESTVSFASTTDFDSLPRKGVPTDLNHFNRQECSLVILMAIQLLQVTSKGHKIKLLIKGNRGAELYLPFAIELSGRQDLIDLYIFDTEVLKEQRYVKNEEIRGRINTALLRLNKISKKIFLLNTLDELNFMMANHSQLVIGFVNQATFKSDGLLKICKARDINHVLFNMDALLSETKSNTVIADYSHVIKLFKEAPRG